MSEEEAATLTIELMGLGFVLGVGVLMCLLRGLSRARGLDPKVVLSRCRWELRLVRDELSHYPATREVHEICAGIDSAEETIDRVAKTLRMVVR